jgi:AAA+ ATPase superfamily predicted ATPase
LEFIDRDAELAFLEGKWRERNAQLVVLWGKRRVGKTELVKQFIQGKPHVYFLSESTSGQEQLKRFSRALGGFFQEPLLETRGFGDWEESFAFVRAKAKRFVLAVDEFPYLVVSNPGVLTLFQKAWDEYWSKSNVFLILMGSSITMMENEVLGYRSPLYGRRTGQWRVDPMNFEAVSAFREQKPFTDRLSHFAVAGGIPAYWLKFNPRMGFSSNLERRVLMKGEPLYDEVEFILREELREPRIYFALLQAVSQGKRKLSEIMNATGIPQSAANKYLSVLADLRIVEREVPVTEEKPLKSKKGLYAITDDFFRFWFRFVFPRRAELEMGRITEVRQRIMDELSVYLGSVYEKVARQQLRRHLNGRFAFSAIGRWWDRNAEIDVVALDPEQNAILFGEVKWSRKAVGTDILEGLKRKAAGVQWGKEGRKELFCLFGSSGYTRSLLKQAKSEGVLLFREDRLISLDG